MVFLRGFVKLAKSIWVVPGVFIGISVSLSSSSLARYLRRKREERHDHHFAEDRIESPIKLRSDEILRDGVIGLIGNTPLIRINSLSNALGVEILFLNPGGSVKDRVALRMIDDAERQGLLYPYTGSCIFEGTVGSTGISIATLAPIIMPDDVAEEKAKNLLALGAKVEKVRPASIVDKKQNLAKQRAWEYGRTGMNDIITQDDTITTTGASEEVLSSNAGSPYREETLKLKPRGFFADQFESKSNYSAHFEGTGPEIWRQTNGRLHAFVAGAGTGGTIAGTGQFLKSMDENILIALADPEGSGLYNKVKYGVMFDRKESEGTKRRHQVDTVVEGIGINRLTNNFEMAIPVIKDAFRIMDSEAVAMSRYLVLNDGLFLGSSSACNLVACIKLVKKLRWKEGQTVVTILNDEYLTTANIAADESIITEMLESI
ncbi:tryptophan synthase beta subunit-like PLP-dependent enzyme [Hysterangium stoloniferum]|nr:tryptophan synthase beta subunit-like PLP-dependent enzyme [Hysterangium stoloniferum]